jgi:hypothetical protein
MDELAHRRSGGKIALRRVHDDGDVLLRFTEQDLMKKLS